MDFTGFMAAFALAAFWLNTLLIAAAGWRECAALRRRYAHMFSGTGPRRAAITAAEGPEGALARWRAQQVGRSNGRGPIVFHDRGWSSEVYGGAVDGLELAAGAPAEVWISQAAKRRAAACPDAEAFNRALPAASKAAGYERAVAVPLRLGETIWLMGQVDTGLVLADADPRRWRARITWLTIALVVGVVVVAGACTVACLWPPAFGTVAKLGAFAALVAFNLFQLFGKLHRDAIQPPAARVLDGQWSPPRG